MATTASPSTTSARSGTSPAPVSDTAAWPPGEVVRDVARGGIAGLVAGVVVGGIGGRLVMRFAALVVPEATGRFTENGNRIGDITLGGSLGLIIGIGLFAGIGIGFLWVTVRPWLPGGVAVRAVLAMLVAASVGAFTLIEGTNSDFAVLQRSPVVVAALLLLIASCGLAVAVIDDWLELRLPHPGSVGAPSTAVYTLVTALGLLFGALLIVPAYLLSDLRLVGLSLLATGIATLAWWALRLRGLRRPPTGLVALGRGGIVLAVVTGVVALGEELRLALAIR